MAEEFNLKQAMTDKMRWHSARQKYLAQNIGNADTPGYRPQDLKPLDFKKIMKSTTSSSSLSAAGTMATTRNNHISTSGGGHVQLKGVEAKKTYEVAPKGNAVILEEQVLNMNENTLEHRFVTNLYQAQIGLEKRAVDGK